MKIDITSMFFNSKIEGQTATPAWGTSVGQNKSRECRIDDFKPEVVNLIIGMTYKSVSDLHNLDVSKGSSGRDIVTCSVFTDIYINNKKLENTQFVLLLVREHSKSHDGRLIVSYAPYIKYNNIANQECIDLMRQSLGCSSDGCWFVYDITIKNQSKLYFNAVVVNPTSPMVYSNLTTSRHRSEEWKALIPTETPKDYNDSYNQPLQQIFYGAPGTGKSHTIKETTDKVDSKFVVRTTFHPDSDYSTFVGAYKPKMEVMPRFNPQTGEQMGVEKRIVYAYTPQAFLKAYITAWQNPEQPVYLIIEEINRGNCAQIFGDLFQLLDRGDDGYSCYPIKADQDMQMHLIEAFAGNDALPENIRSGEELVLPSNLYIWATMNTSDQSLFPIDSAFKRRWEWKYVPITQGRDKGQLLQWSIEAEGVKYDWWSFLEVMNKRVGDITSSEDKKLGFFFCKADGQGVISADKFVSKVMFYLWNDVFKDYPDNPIAMYLKEEGGEFTFGDFYTTNAGGDVVVREELVTRLFGTNALGVKKFEAASNDDGEYTPNSKPTTDVKTPTETQQAYHKFWEGLIAYGANNSDYKQYFGRRATPSYDKWLSYSIDLPDTALCVDLTSMRNELAVKIVPQRAAYEKMQEKQKEVNEKFDEQLVWNAKEGKKEAEIAIVWNVDDFSGIHNDSMYEKVVGYMLKMRQVFCEMFSQK